ncbi:MAG: hypothetical protein ACOZQL_29150 [Myxococcota bacterium]
MSTPPARHLARVEERRLTPPRLQRRSVQELPLAQLQRRGLGHRCEEIDPEQLLRAAEEDAPARRFLPDEQRAERLAAGEPARAQRADDERAVGARIILVDEERPLTERHGARGAVAPRGAELEVRRRMEARIEGAHGEPAIGGQLGERVTRDGEVLSDGPRARRRERYAGPSALELAVRARPADALQHLRVVAAHLARRLDALLVDHHAVAVEAACVDDGERLARAGERMGEPHRRVDPVGNGELAHDAVSTARSDEGGEVARRRDDELERLVERLRPHRRVSDRQRDDRRARIGDERADPVRLHARRRERVLPRHEVEARWTQARIGRRWRRARRQAQPEEDHHA